MNKTFAAACLAAVTIAREPLGKRRNNPGFVNFMSTNNKHYSNTAEMNMRAGLYSTTVSEVSKLNARSARSGRKNAATFKTNFLSDLSDAEKSSYFGLQEKDKSKRAKLYNRGVRGGRVGVVDATTVDHYASGNMYAVKDQGQCGSCYAFASNTALEGYISKKNGTTPVRLSEQHLVDCTLRKNDYNKQLFNEDFDNWGCDGGWMDENWKFQKKHGAMLDSDYAYTSGRSERETRCAHDDSKIVGKVQAYGQVSSDIQSIKEKLATHPMTIAVDASSYAFQTYSGGVLDAGSRCGRSLNHAVVLVGYTDKGDDNGDSDESDDDSDDEPVDPVDSGCTVTKWWHSCTDDSRRQLQDDNGNENYWKIQNSWGTGWGDQGFILFEQTEGNGICGMNAYVEWAEL